MTLSAGATLGPFEIVAPIGAGGMGEVYKARDTRLGRDVAIKVLPAEFAEDPEPAQESTVVEATEAGTTPGTVEYMSGARPERGPQQRSGAGPRRKR